MVVSFPSQWHTSSEVVNSTVHAFSVSGSGGAPPAGGDEAVEKVILQQRRTISGIIFFSLIFGGKTCL